MSTLVNPKFVLVQSETNKTQFFYLVLMDLPADTSAYPDPSEITPVLDGTDLCYTTNDYSLPEGYDGNVKTYLLKPFMVVSEDESLPNIKTITFQAKTTKKKGDTGGILSKQIYTDPNKVSTPNLETSLNYICKDRCFVIKSNDTYFVGTLVDYPSDVVPGRSTHLINSNELEIERVEGSNPNKTFLAYSSSPASYDPSAEPPTASYAAIFVNGYNTHEHKGILCYNGIDLYADAWPAESGAVVNSI